MENKIYFLILFSLLSLCFSSNILLKPIHDGEEIGIIFLQGALMPNDRYAPWCTQLQLSLPDKKLWISIPDIILELPFEPIASLAISGAKKELQNAGFSVNSKIYIAGHSLGGIAAADWGISNSQQIAGIIQLGSFLDRKYRTVEIKVPVLMVGGEMDGLSRITRFAEEFYNRIGTELRVEAIKNTPIVVLEGVNHNQFSSGAPSSFVKERDLKAENSDEDSRKMIASVVAAFLMDDSEKMNRFIQNTQQLLEPIIESFLNEGSIHFNRPNQSTCSQGYCSEGSNWAITAQQFLAEKDLYDAAGINLEITNDYVILSSLPPFGKLFHPKLTKNDNTVSITTYSQCSWDFLDKYIDGGFSPVSAKEIGSKMLTRQCSLVNGLDKPKNETPLSVDDGVDLCAEINKNALAYAFNKTRAKTLNRYNQFGQKLTFGPDKKVTNGFSWVYGELEFNDNGNEVNVISLVMISDIDAPAVPIFAPDGGNCYHYCKLMSPARAIEWIYVDGLRKNYSINN